MVAADPSEPEGYRQRGLLHIQLERLAAARADLERYLALAPGAPDRKEIEKQVNSLKQWIAGMN
jgi:regulator of sirC expression with transglutaminase-like and TPR domain